MSAKKPPSPDKAKTKPRPKAVQAAEVATVPDLNAELNLYARLRASGLCTQSEAVRAIRPWVADKRSRDLGSEWEARTKATIATLRKAAAKAAELVHGVTKASAIDWLLKVRDCELSPGKTPPARLVQKCSVTKRYDKDGNVTSETTVFEIPSKMSAQVEISKIVGLYAQPDEQPVEPDDEGPADTLGAFLREFVRPGLPIEHRQADVAAGRIIDAKVTVVRPGKQEAVDSDGE